MHYSNINGKLVPAEEAKALIQHIAAISGTGLLETILIRNGSIQLMDYHWDRLMHGMQTLGLPAISLGSLQDEILRTITDDHLKELCRIRLQVFGDKQSRRSKYIIECIEIDPDIIGYNQEGLTLGIAEGVCKMPDDFTNLKTTKRGLYDVALEIAKVKEWDDALLINDKGHIIESTIANVFWVKESVLYTTPLSEGCVAGVMRRYLLEELAKNSVRITETMLTEDAISGAEEVFLTNAIRRIRWVRAVGSCTYSNQLSSKIYSLLFS